MRKSIVYSRLSRIITNKKAKLSKQALNKWHNSIFKSFRTLQLDTRGDVGKEFIAYLLESIGKTVEPNKITSRKLKQWDFLVKPDGLTLEVRTASLGTKSTTFQHENLRKERKYDGLILLDIAPNDLYITCLCKESIEWDKLHKRLKSEIYKLDLEVGDLKNKKITTLKDFERIYNEMKDCINSHKGKRKDARDI